MQISNPTPKVHATPAYEELVRERLELVATCVAWWQRTSHEEHVAVVRDFIEFERSQALLANASQTPELRHD